ncbi:MAG: NfeD family protein [Clostridiales bacterium]|nr:NfeD family protein [Clostridiales bacterium]
MNNIFSPQIIWVVLMIIFVVVEAISLGLTSIWFAFGALIALISSYFIDSFIIQVTIFVISSIAALYFTKPLVKKYLKVGRERTNVDSLIGENGVVVKEIKKYETGQVKVKGQIWTAYSEDEIEVGTDVTVEEVKGVRLKVRKEE